MKPYRALAQSLRAFCRESRTALWALLASTFRAARVCLRADTKAARMLGSRPCLTCGLTKAAPAARQRPSACKLPKDAADHLWQLSAGGRSHQRPASLAACVHQPSRLSQRCSLGAADHVLMLSDDLWSRLHAIVLP